LELLTLSACDTAAGDDRAALGLAGMAIKAGARSALATLWNINDEASVELVVDFYRELKEPSISRAIALQRAQIKLLSNPRYEHPGFWSPFLMINNWL
jgi:CHAT domain-containing protein